MSKKKKIIIMGAILLAILLAFIGGRAYAKYAAQVRGDGMAEIATWSFKVNNQTEEVQTINLASTYDNETLVDNKIAPGTEGSFNIVVDGRGSDVGINYNIDITEKTQKPTNLKFIYNNVEYNSLQQLKNNLSGTIDANAEDNDKVKTLEIGWKWEYETGANNNEIATNDIQDTNDGKTLQNYQFDIIVSGTQVVPENNS